MKPSIVFHFILLLSAFVWPVAGLAQTDDLGPVSIGGFVSAGVQAHDAPNETSPNGTATRGLYVEWNRFRIHPGLEVRHQGDSNVRGTLVGPRISSSFGPFHPYMVALFGPNSAAPSLLSPSARGGILTASTPFHGIDGVTKGGAIGLDADLSRHFRWRVLEFTKGSFSGIPGSAPQTLTTGIVIHVP